MTDRIIRVTTCAECPHCDIDWAVSPRCGQIELTNPTNRLPDFWQTIPDWCPLERAQEPKGASDEG